MIKDEGLTSGQKACLGILTPALLFLPVVLLLAMFRSNIQLIDLMGAGLDQPIVQLFWGLVFVALIAILGFFLATIRHSKFITRKERFQQHMY